MLAAVAIALACASSASAVKPNDVLISDPYGHPRTVIGIIPSFIDPSVQPHFSARPHRFLIRSADSQVLFKRLVWKYWGRFAAVAHGRAKTCGEGGIEGYVCHTGAVRLVAKDPIDCGGGPAYLSLISYGVPDYGGEVELPVAPLDC